MRLHLFLPCCEVVVKLLRSSCKVLFSRHDSIELCGVGGWSIGLETIKSILLWQWILTTW